MHDHAATPLFPGSLSPEGQRNFERSRAAALDLIERDRRRKLAAFYQRCAAQRTQAANAAATLPAEVPA
jgi:hypothetical protein